MYAMVNAWCMGSYASEMGGLIVCLAQRKTKIAALLIAEKSETKQLDSDRGVSVKGKFEHVQ
jgi:hypothetical protein